MGDTARAQQPPTNRKPNEPAGLYVPKKAYFEPNLVFFGPTIQVFLGGSKSFGTLVTKDQLGTLFTLFMAGQGIKWVKNASIWPKMTTNAYFGLDNETSFTFGLSLLESPNAHKMIIFTQLQEKEISFFKEIENPKS